MRAINAVAPIRCVERAAVELGFVLDVGAADVAGRMGGGGVRRHDPTITSVGLEVPGDIDQGRLTRWLEELLAGGDTGILRSKGVLVVAGHDRQYVVQGVHRRFQAAYGHSWGRRARVNRMVFIGRDLDGTAIVRSFAECLRSGDC